MLVLILSFVGFLTLWAVFESQAALQAVGPINPENGFPMWYEDETGMRLQLCLNDPFFCTPGPVVPSIPFSREIGFGEEALYWSADARIPVPPGGALLNEGNALLVLAAGTAFFNVLPFDGDQTTFGRIRLRIDVPVPGTYTITHPYGVEVYNVAGPGVRAIDDIFAAPLISSTRNRVGDFGCLTIPCDFSVALDSGIGPFLVATDPPPPFGFVGDPFIDQFVTGSPFGTNFFRVEGPAGSNLGGPGVDFIETDVFQVQGQLPTRYQDVSTMNFAFQQIEAISDAGITGGCAANPSKYCPGGQITRGQMAVFIETSLGNPPSACTGRFADVPATHPFCGFIERLAADGITGGCTATNFCPEAPVTRAQMAVFVETALGNPPDTCTGTRFNDVTAASVGTTVCGFIERLAADGITGGCTTNDFFCPNDPVTRAQMAVFIVTAPAPLQP
jgi:hypothetical protein